MGHRKMGSRIWVLLVHWRGRDSKLTLKKLSTSYTPGFILNSWDRRLALMFFPSVGIPLWLCTCMCVYVCECECVSVCVKLMSMEVVSFIKFPSELTSNQFILLSLFTQWSRNYAYLLSWIDCKSIKSSAE